MNYILAIIEPCHNYTCIVTDEQENEIERVSFCAEDGAIIYDILKKYNTNKLYIQGKQSYVEEYIKGLEEQHINGDYCLNDNLELIYIDCYNRR